MEADGLCEYVCDVHVDYTPYLPLFKQEERRVMAQVHPVMTEKFRCVLA
jgi:hypothetical protein